MSRLCSVLEIIVPIFLTIGLGILARGKKLMTQEQIQGLQGYVTRFGLPCVLFNSCLGADMGAEAVTSMALVTPLWILSTCLAFRIWKKRFPCHNTPMLFAAVESGMLGIPLFMVLFGAEQAFRMGVLDLGQSLVAIPVIALLSADAGESPSPRQILGKVLRSPLLIMSLLGFALNLSGAAVWLDGVGVGGILRQSTGFLAQPVSAVMLFSVGYNFTLDRKSRGKIFQLSAIHAAQFALFCLVMEGILLLLPDVVPQTRWAVLLMCTLPSSYLAPGLGRNEEEYTLAAGVCSVTTVLSLVVFCIVAAVAV